MKLASSFAAFGLLWSEVKAQDASSSTSAAISSTTTLPDPTTVSSTAPSPTYTPPCLTLTDNFQYPHLIVDWNMTTGMGSSESLYSPTIADKSMAVFNFDIPSSYANMTCDLVWALPNQDQLVYSSYDEHPIPSPTAESGANVPPNDITAFLLEEPAGLSMTPDTFPAIVGGGPLAVFAAHGLTTIMSGPCAAGETVGYAMWVAYPGYNYSLTYFQNYAPCAIGLYITAH